MKKLMKTLLGIGLGILIAVNVWALPIEIDDHLIMNTGGLTTFNMTNTNTSDDWSYYSSFCVESSVYFTPGSEYIVKSVVDYVDINNDYLSNKTKWLYATYMTNPSNYNTDLTQSAVWWLENESGGYKVAWATFFKQATGLDKMNGYDFTSILSDWDIKIINLTDINSNNVQSQMVGSLTPVPEPTTLILFGMGLLGIVHISNKKKT